MNIFHLVLFISHLSFAEDNEKWETNNGKRKTNSPAPQSLDPA